MSAPGSPGRIAKEARKEQRIVDATACPVCGSPAGQKCREGIAVHDARRGQEDLRPWLERTHRDRRAKALEGVRIAASLARRTFAGGRPAKGPRCACGAMSAARAKKRYHSCEKGDA